MKTILFVDDEPLMLHGLKRMLREKAEVWNMEYVESGREALEIMSSKHVDIVVSDMRMPEMDGVELLNKVRVEHPDTVRIVLSGYSEKDMILRSVGTAHQYLSKPCSAAGLEETIARALSLKQVLTDKHLQQLVSKIDGLPTLPRLYKEIMDELAKDDPDNHLIAEIVNKDIGLTAKILQIINSAFFGLRRSVSDVHEAVRMLGTDTIKALALSVGVFSQIHVRKEHAADLNEIWEHSMEVGMTCKKISIFEGSEMSEEAFTVGFLHDVGTLVMLSSLPGLYAEVKELVADHGMTRVQAEKEIYGTTHAAVGAYLLGLWGLPRNMVEAVAFYMQPGEHSYRSFRPLTALHVAHTLCKSNMDSIEDFKSELDLAYLEQIRAIDNIEAWYEIYHDIHDCVPA